MKLYKIKVNTFFYFFPKDLDQFDPKPSFDVEVYNTNTVADFQTKLFEMVNLSDSDYVAEFYSKGFNVGAKLNAEDKIDDGETVFAVFSSKIPLERVVEHIKYKEADMEIDYKIKDVENRSSKDHDKSKYYSYEIQSKYK